MVVTVLGWLHFFNICLPCEDSGTDIFLAIQGILFSSAGQNLWGFGGNCRSTLADPSEKLYLELCLSGNNQSQYPYPIELGIPRNSYYFAWKMPAFPRKSQQHLARVCTSLRERVSQHNFFQDTVRCYALSGNWCLDTLFCRWQSEQTCGPLRNEPEHKASWWEYAVVWQWHGGMYSSNNLTKQFFRFQKCLKYHPTSQE